MNITSMSSGELYKTLSGRDANVFKLTNMPQMRDKIKAVYPSNRDEFIRDEDNLDGRSVTTLFESAFPIKALRMSNEQLSQHFGDIGKRLDEAYAQGKFTEEEYNELNAGLDEYIEHATSQTEKMRAVWETGKQNMDGRFQAMKTDEYHPLTETRSVEEIKAEKAAEINNYVKNVCGIDRDMLRSMIHLVRYGNAEMINSLLR